MKNDTKLTVEQSAQIIKLVDEHGWRAVHEHPVLGPIWKKRCEEARKFVNKNIDSDWNEPRRI